MSGRHPRENKKKNVRLDAMQSMKDQKAKAEQSSALEAFELDEDEDVFETMDESEYADVVEKRRNAGDFVVDDGK